MKKRIMVLYSTGGMGHKKAAMALVEEFRKRPDVEAQPVDALELAGKFYNYVYRDLYVKFMTGAKWIWGALYDFTNVPVVDRLTRPIRLKMDLAGIAGLVPMIKRSGSDAIVATHFMLPSVAETLKRDKEIKARLYTVLTDYGPHSYWLSGAVDKFFVGSEKAALEMEKRGISPSRLEVTGIPTESVFQESFDRDPLKAKYALHPTRKTVFMLSGGFGVGPMREMLLAMNLCSSSLQVIAVCGHNKKIFKDLESLKADLKYPLILLGYTEKVAEIMAVSDIMVTKAGGISVTEALNARLPMILFASIPGQETWNEDFLVSSGAGVKAECVKDIPTLVDRALSGTSELPRMREAIDKVRRPNAAVRIADTVMREMGA